MRQQLGLLRAGDICPGGTRSHDNDVKKGQTSVRSKREKKKKCRNMSTSKSFKKKKKKEAWEMSGMAVVPSFERVEIVTYR